MSFARIASVLLLTMVAAQLQVPAVAEETAPADVTGKPEIRLKITSVELTAQPMVFVTMTASMSEIPTLMGTAFATLGQFLSTSGVAPLGPPLAVYHDWSGSETAVDVGFPVSAADAQKASGSVLAGATPSGYALKVVHLGPYDDFPATYAAIDAAMKHAGIPDSTRMWEVYLGEPGITPDAELVTEIYMQVSAIDAAKFATK